MSVLEDMLHCAFLMFAKKLYWQGVSLIEHHAFIVYLPSTTLWSWSSAFGVANDPYFATIHILGARCLASRKCSASNYQSRTPEAADLGSAQLSFWSVNALPTDCEDSFVEAAFSLCQVIAGSL
jgi:hypothetical protein